MDKIKFKSQFESLFPDWALAFNAAKSQNDILKIQDDFIKEQKENFKRAMMKTSSSDTDQTIPISLGHEQYEKLINARGNEIHVQIQLILDGLDRLRNMADTSSPAAVTAQIIGFGSLAVGLAAGLTTFNVLTGAALVTEAVTISASLAGVVAVGVGAVVAGAALLVGLILIPFIYYMVKPAICILFLINELDKEIVFKEEYNIHGKATLITDKIGKSVSVPTDDGIQKFTNGGLFSTSKRDGALVGAQYGFVMKYKNLDLSFGVECPLNGKNNCYSAFNKTAKQVAELTEKNVLQYHEITQDEITLSIRANSGSGSVAWYVARAYSK